LNPAAIIPQMSVDNSKFIGRIMPVSDTVGFEDVDRYKNPKDFVAYLERVNLLPAIRRYKARVFEMLDLHSGDFVLDVGCGTGSDIREMVLATNSKARFVGIDSSEIMVGKARSLTPDSMLESRAVSYLRGNVSQLPFNNGTFDSVRADRVFQHLGKEREAIREIIRVTKPGGKIVIADSYWGRSVNLR